jgi:hypothetical protein
MRAAASMTIGATLKQLGDVSTRPILIRLMSDKIPPYRRLGRYITSLGFLAPKSLVAAVAATILTETISHLNLTLPGDVNTTVLLPLKAGLAGVLAAAMLAFWGFFWSETLAPSTKSRDLPYVVKDYRPWFAWLAPALLLLFVSIGADFYLVLVDKKSPGAAAISFGTFGAAMFMIGLFVLDFISRLSRDMKDLLDAGLANSKVPDPQQHKITKERHDAAKAAFSTAGYSGPLTVAANTTADEHIFVLSPAAFNQISKWTDLTLVLQELLDTRVSIVQESESMPALTQFE